ncbi:hypothetical protein GGQ87_002202 [Brevundimonas alba]|uniref:Uncharacterized protein n=1 Tax=Brevundimonas alba TaxID=74314 RepID=A0A7X5YL29_9CAUL|nr:hypothetical protein [Brevundimonas alba]NJC41907.1 hypothetical protein [Brevundimonas alba]
MGGVPQNRHGLIPVLVAIRVAAERKRRKAEAEAAAVQKDTSQPPKKKRGWFG